MALAAECGLDAEAARAALDEPARRATIVALETQAQRWGISGVPTFIFERRYAFSGAQPLEVFLDAIDQVAREAGAGGASPAGAEARTGAGAARGA